MTNTRSDHESKATDRRLAAELTAMLAPHLEGMKVTVGHSRRWNRPGVTFRWRGFASLLPEERFHRLVRVMPEQFRESRLRSYVWLELAPGETVEQFLSLPRSEDLAGRERQILADLRRLQFFDRLAAAMAPNPRERCMGDFSLSQALLKSRRLGVARVREAKLAFICYGVYCDCQVLCLCEREPAEADDGD